MRDEPSDEDLLLSISTDPDAFEVLYRRHIGKILGFAVRRCGSPEEVADLVSAVFLQAIESAPRFDPQRGRAVPWLLGIAAHERARARRSRRRETRAIERLEGRELLDQEDHQRLAEQIDAARAAPRVREALDRLPPAERQMLELTSLDGLTPSEAAEVLRIRPATARMRLNRGRKKLRRVLGDSERTPSVGRHAAVRPVSSGPEEVLDG